jgi:hypothetical protein
MHLKIAHGYAIAHESVIEYFSVGHKLHIKLSDPKLS